MFTILVISTNELPLFFLEVLFILKSKLELRIQKQLYTLLLFNNLLGPSEDNTITIGFE